MPQFQLTATSKPSLDDVPDLIADAEQELDAQLGNMGYVIPVVQTTSPMAWQIVVSLTAYGAIWRILEARNAAVGGDATAASAKRAYEYVQERLKWLLDPKHPFELTDCPRTATQVVKPAEILQRIEIPDSCEGENWPFSRETRRSQVF